VRGHRVAVGQRRAALPRLPREELAIEDLEAWIEQSVVTPATPAPVSPPSTAPLRADEQPSMGRLTLTPEMGANRRPQAL